MIEAALVNVFTDSGEGDNGGLPCKEGYCFV